MYDWFSLSINEESTDSHDNYIYSVLSLHPSPSPHVRHRLRVDFLEPSRAKGKRGRPRLGIEAVVVARGFTVLLAPSPTIDTYFSTTSSSTWWMHANPPFSSLYYLVVDLTQRSDRGANTSPNLKMALLPVASLQNRSCKQRRSLPRQPPIASGMPKARARSAEKSVARQPQMRNIRTRFSDRVVVVASQVLK